MFSKMNYYIIYFSHGQTLLKHANINNTISQWIIHFESSDKGYYLSCQHIITWFHMRFHLYQWLNQFIMTHIQWKCMTLRQPNRYQTTPGAQFTKKYHLISIGKKKYCNISHGKLYLRVNLHFFGYGIYNWSSQTFVLNKSSSPIKRNTSGALQYIHLQLQHWVSVCYVMNVAFGQCRAICYGLHSFKCATEVQFIFDPLTRQHFSPQYLRDYKARCVYKTVYLAPTFTRGIYHNSIRCEKDDK